MQTQIKEREVAATQTQQQVDKQEILTSTWVRNPAIVEESVAD